MWVRVNLLVHNKHVNDEYLFDYEYLKIMYSCFIFITD